MKSSATWIGCPLSLAAAGEPDIKEKLLKGHQAGKKTFKVHLDGYNFLPHFKGEEKCPRVEYFYFSDDGDLMALRYDNWKADLHGAADARYPADLAGTVGVVTVSEALQPAHGPLRAGGYHLEHLLGLGDQSHLPVLARAGDRGGIS